MEKLISAWKGMSGPERRNSVIAIVVVATITIYGLTHRKSADQSGSNSRHYVRAGGIICNDQYQAAMQARTKGMITEQEIQGCQVVGTNIEVNILRQTSFNGFDVVQVGNQGGVGWAVADDVN